jgi:glycosyltransferase involved in cell wall biosynthesis
MKIIYIVEASIEHDVGGGGEGTRKVYHALRSYCAKNNSELCVVSLNDNLPESLPFKPIKNKKLDMLARAFGHSNYLYFWWRKQKLELLALKPDVIVLGRSRYGFMAKDVKKLLPSCRIVSVFENVEMDYVKSYFAAQKGVKRLALVMLESIAVKRDEGDCVKYSDARVYLSKRDRDRIREIFGEHNKPYETIPVCLKSATKLRGSAVLSVACGSEPQPARKIIFSGRLWYNSNIESAEWILDNLVPAFADCAGLRFVIAGSRPSDELREKICQHKNVEFYPNFKSKDDIMPRFSLILAPDFSGAGMKVKIADALSMGCMAVATDEALVGYEETNGIRGIVRANTAEAYMRAINDWLTMNETDLEEIEAENMAAFEKYYSYERAEKGYARILG